MVIDDDLPKIGAPATLALEAVGVTRLSQLVNHSERELLAIPGLVRGRCASSRMSSRDEGYRCSNARAVGQAPTPVSIPVGFTTFPGEIWRTPRSWVDRAYPNVIYFNEVDKGGHFAAWEEPELFSEELRSAFRPLR